MMKRGGIPDVPDAGLAQLSCASCLLRCELALNCSSPRAKCLFFPCVFMLLSWHKDANSNLLVLMFHFCYMHYFTMCKMQLFCVPVLQVCAF